MDSAQSYKQIHEDFVSNLSGTTVWEIQGITCVAATCVLLRDVVLCTWPRVGDQPWCKLLLDWTILVLPLQFCLTILSDHWLVTLALLLTITSGLCIALATHSHRLAGVETRPSIHTNLLAPPTLARSIITNLRGSLLLCTAIAILAVDFPVFPRRFGKAETYGSGLMDAGVGLFTAVMGLVSREARLPPETNSTLGSRLSHMGRTLKTSCPLLVLGAIRLIMVKSSDYQEHVTEYGVHWNFFFTLAIVRILSTGLMVAWRASKSWVLAVLCAGLYQCLLSYGGLRESLLHGFHGDGQRHGLLDSNREGVISCLGYVAIYWAGVSIGQFFFLRTRTTLRDWVVLIGQLCVGFVVMNSLLVLSEARTEPISRRLANLSYILWVISMLFQNIGLFVAEAVIILVIDTYWCKQGRGRIAVESRNHQCLMSAANFNSLAFFIISNLLTGVINKSVSTIYASPAMATFIITAYLLTLFMLISLLYSKKIRIKL